MKRGKRALSVLLVLVLSAALCIPALAANMRYRVYSHYLCLGDSVAAGYGLPYDESKEIFDKTGKMIDWNAVCMGRKFETMPNAYLSLAADKLTNVWGGKTTVTQGAYAALRASEVRYMLLGDVFNDPDPTHSWDYAFLPFGSDEEAIKKGLADMNRSIGTYEKLVKESDLITLNLGANDVLASCIISAFSEDAAGFAEGAASPNEMMSQMLTKYLAPGKLAETKRVIEEGCEVNEVCFIENYSAILERIRVLNPNATVVLVGTYNVFNDVTMGLGDLSFLLKSKTKEMNKLIQNLAEEYGCRFADVTDVELYGANLNDKNAMDAFLVKMHPTPAGHQYIANQILQQLLTNEEIPGDVDGSNAVNEADAILLLNHTLRPERYAVNQSTDYNGDGRETDADAVYLRNYILNPSANPLRR